MGRRARVLSFLGLAIAVASAGWFVRGISEPRSGAVSAGTGDAAVATVARGRIEQTVRARGIVKPAPNALVRVGFPMPKDVSRRIRSLRVVEGDAVRAGAVLGELDTSDLRAMLQELHADAAVVQKRLDALRALRPQDVRLAETVRDEAAVQADLAERNLERGRQLRDSALLPPQEYEALAMQSKVADARRANAEAALNQVHARFDTDIATLEAQLNQAHAAIRNVEVQLEWGVLRAPFDGIVFAVHQRPGELTSNQPGVPVLTLLDANGLQVHLFVDETDFGKVQIGQPVTLQIEAHPEERVSGTIARLLPQPVLQENVVYYLALVDPDETYRSLLRAEMTTLAFIQTGGNESVLWVPTPALQSRSDGWYVRRRTATGVVDTPVQIGMRGEGRVEIRSGLPEGAEVLIDR
jgi:HlyD family secretion protein/macrolide-specific efflux system membrane fusion protein